MPIDGYPPSREDENNAANERRKRRERQEAFLAECHQEEIRKKNLKVKQDQDAANKAYDPSKVPGKITELAAKAGIEKKNKRRFLFS